MGTRDFTKATGRKDHSHVLKGDMAGFGNRLNMGLKDSEESKVKPR